MAHFIRLKLLTGEAKINLDKVSIVTLNRVEHGRDSVSVWIDNEECLYTEGITIENAEKFYNQFPS